jgi:UDP-galactopyranose mutase
LKIKNKEENKLKNLLNKKYDLIIAGSGLFGSVIAHQAIKDGLSCLVLEKRNHIGGNVYCEEIEGIQVHKYGAHIFHTSDLEVWNYITAVHPFNNFINSPLACHNDEFYNLPFNMNTFYKLWGTKTPKEAKDKIEQQIANSKITNPKNLEEQAISLVGNDIYQKLIKGYTEKQWGRPCNNLPAFIIKRIPLRFTFDNNYFNDKYQGIPAGGYNPLTEKLLKGADIKTNCNFNDYKNEFLKTDSKIIYTGPIDEYYDYKLGTLEYRSLRFDHKILNTSSFQGNAVINYTDYNVLFTRILEHKHFDPEIQSKKTVITKEYPQTWHKGMEPYYPINDDKNNEIYEKYKKLSQQENRIHFGGRLAEYKYYDMDKIVRNALDMYKTILK